ncbi:J domain-containing protein [Planobispora siamensis]|uniref:J domain-containing protein n=1 Tax=Planobispora siamensis TaxID=936338 RepID=A0A8J3SD71_9ACTN|nr:hypothetical protein Psi01_26030 [Planobispora siamensis]
MLRPSDIKPCSRCGADIRWTLTEARKRLAVNAEPDPDGNTAVVRDVAGTLRSRAVTAERPLLPHERLMKPHAATCAPPAPGAGRRRRKAPRPAQARQEALYDVLGVTTTATPAEIRSAYRRLARELHPDVNPASGDRFKQVTAAYTVLSNPISRATYDLTGRAPRPR